MMIEQWLSAERVFQDDWLCYSRTGRTYYPDSSSETLLARHQILPSERSDIHKTFDTVDHTETWDLCPSRIERSRKVDDVVCPSGFDWPDVRCALLGDECKPEKRKARRAWIDKSHNILSELISEPTKTALIIERIAEALLPKNTEEFYQSAKLDSLPCLNAHIKETLRFYPGAPMVNRITILHHALEDRPTASPSPLKVIKEDLEFTLQELAVYKDSPNRKI
ncbi:hypothetical protein FB446DRAFT_704238 [Lentinula raphanica]|nr:hypothetical protein FB446DRAFT_704238 [Lentinula raphanica]